MPDGAPQSTNEQLPPAGWYADPYDPREKRYWDGGQWTSRVGGPSRADRKRDLKEAGGFLVEAAYLGGHPKAVKPAFGDLALSARTLAWSGAPRSRWGRKEQEIRFEIDLAAIKSVEYKGRDELRNAPKGYWVPLPVPWLPGYGSQPKHPAAPNSKVTQLLVIEFVDDFGDAQTAVFANTVRMGDFGPMMDRGRGGQELANRIVAARYEAKASS